MFNLIISFFICCMVSTYPQYSFINDSSSIIKENRALTTQKDNQNKNPEQDSNIKAAFLSVVVTIFTVLIIMSLLFLCFSKNGFGDNY